MSRKALLPTKRIKDYLVPGEQSREDSILELVSTDIRLEMSEQHYLADRRLARFVCFLDYWLTKELVGAPLYFWQ